MLSQCMSLQAVFALNQQHTSNEPDDTQQESKSRCVKAEDATQKLLNNAMLHDVLSVAKRQEGLRCRNSPMCTLSQHGYGGRFCKCVAITNMAKTGSKLFQSSWVVLAIKRGERQTQQLILSPRGRHLRLEALCCGYFCLDAGILQSDHARAPARTPGVGGPAHVAGQHRAIAL